MRFSSAATYICSKLFSLMHPRPKRVFPSCRYVIHMSDMIVAMRPLLVFYVDFHLCLICRSIAMSFMQFILYARVVVTKMTV